MRFSRFLFEQETFDIREIDKFVSIDKKLEYAKKRFEQIGEGSSRVVFNLKNGYVLKLAKNMKGIYQNLSETEPALNSMYPDLIARIKKYDQDSENIYWIISQKAEEMTEESFQKLTNISFKDFRNTIKTYSDFMKNKITIVPDEVEAILNTNKITSQVKDLMEEFELTAGDLTKLSSWGIINNKPKLIDVGLTRTLYNAYYKGQKK